jgi:hypothetical protein
MYTITLNNGTKLENLELNGNNYIAEGVIEDSVFQDNLASVTITDGKTTETYTDMVLISNRVDGGRSWFILGVKSEKEKQEEATARRIAELEQAMTVLLTGKEE